MEEIIQRNDIDAYNKRLGIETFHPLVTVYNLKDVPHPEGILQEATYRYGVYALFLKNTKSCIMRYGHKDYDYSDGTVVSFAPGQVVHVKPVPNADHDVLSLLFHPDLIRGTSLGQHISEYHFFDYASNEALHMSERERTIYLECLENIRQEVIRPVDKFSKKLICRNIELLLDYCMRFYDRQFVTREDDNHSVMKRFEEALNEYFSGKVRFMNGLPTVKYFAEQCFLSANYFGDLIKKETGMTPQDFIQHRVIELAKEELLSSNKTITEIAYQLGFQYSQHFNRYFKRSTGMTPTEYRKKGVV